jgi:predicted nucleic acid-binding protein
VNHPEGSGLLDTCTVIELTALRSESGLPENPLISTITLAELSVGPLVAADDRERAERQAVLQGAESGFDPIPFDAAAARTFAGVAASLRAAGRKPQARAFDALIAAVAIANNLPLHTCKPDDFRHISGLEVVPVEVPSS